MISYILARKGKQTQMHNAEGQRVPVTYLNTKGIYVTGIRTKEADGYEAVKIGLRTRKRAAKPLQGEIAKAKITDPVTFIKEFRTPLNTSDTKGQPSKEENEEAKNENVYDIGTHLTPDTLFQEGDIVDISGKTKGKGFQGVVKRHGFRGGPKTHGQSDRERAPGSVGAGTTPGRVYKGKKLAGRMGGVNATVKGLTVLRVEQEYIVVKGLVPGSHDQVLSIQKSTKTY
jgi:large subunit ribosomal protein L3